MTAPAASTIAAALRAAGVRPGGVLLAHASLRALGPVEGGAETVIAGLLQALGPEGTLLLPGLSYQHVTREHPVFDVRETPCCVGALPEYFRTRPGTRRSLHPTHSVCGVGARAAELLAGHEDDTTPCGPNSPFRKLRATGGQLLFLGCGLRPNTSMHAIEELVAPPYLYGADVTYTLRDGDRAWQRTYRTHGFAGWGQRYERIAPLLPLAALTIAPCLQATIHLVEVEALWQTALRALREEPLSFVEREG